MSSGYPALWSFPNMINSPEKQTKSPNKQTTKKPKEKHRAVKKTDMTRNGENRYRMSGRSYPFNGTTFTGNRSVGKFAFCPLETNGER